MMELDTCPVSGETPEEERLNYLTHFFGLILCLVGCPWLLFYAIKTGSMMNIMSCILYSITLITMYLISTYYHACQKTDRKKLLRMIDHICIYLLIAGSYTPFALGLLYAHNGVLLLAAVWCMAIVGIILKIVAFNRFRMISLLLYLLMGWLVIVNMHTLQMLASAETLFWLVAGGIIYTAGTIFYVWEQAPYNHAVWHLFVLGGSLSHYFSILYLFA